MKLWCFQVCQLTFSTAQNADRTPEVKIDGAVSGLKPSPSMKKKKMKLNKEK